MEHIHNLSTLTCKLKCPVVQIRDEQREMKMCFSCSQPRIRTLTTLNKNWKKNSITMQMDFRYCPLRHLGSKSTVRSDATPTGVDCAQSLADLQGRMRRCGGGLWACTAELAASGQLWGAHTAPEGGVPGRPLLSAPPPCCTTCRPAPAWASLWEGLTPSTLVGMAALRCSHGVFGSCKV